MDVIETTAEARCGARLPQATIDAVLETLAAGASVVVSGLLLSGRGHIARALTEAAGVPLLSMLYPVDSDHTDIPAPRVIETMWFRVLADQVQVGLAEKSEEVEQLADLVIGGVLSWDRASWGDIDGEWFFQPTEDAALGLVLGAKYEPAA